MGKPYRSGYRRYNNRGNPSTKQNGYKTSNFKGQTEALNGYHFDAMTTKQAEGYNRSRKALMEYFGRTSKVSQCIVESFRREQLYFGELPTKPEDSAEDIYKEIYQEKKTLLKP